jgi:hypothetical protein
VEGRGHRFLVLDDQDTSDQRASRGRHFLATAAQTHKVE